MMRFFGVILAFILFGVTASMPSSMFSQDEEKFFYSDHKQQHPQQSHGISFENPVYNEIIDTKSSHVHKVGHHSAHQQHQQAASASSDKSIENVTVKVGQQAVLPCFVNNLGSHKVIWAKNGDILALGNTKINSDTRLNVQHRYVSEWHLVIDNVVTDDEGEYICKTNGNFYKTINLQVLMPPTIDDVNSTPAGTITIKEGASLTLKCVAEGKPEPTIKWYRWKKYKHLVSEKEEMDTVGNEISITSIKRNDPNIYECIAKNSVPPATSRIFNIEIHFLPVVELDVRKTFQFMNKKFSLECKVNSNPVEKIFWYKNGVILTNTNNENQRIEKYDMSSINDHYRTLLTLTIQSANKEDFGEYQCCAANIFGQTCSDVLVQEIKQTTTKHYTTVNEVTVPRIVSSITDVATPEGQATSVVTSSREVGDSDLEQDLPNLISDDLTPVNSYEDYRNSNELSAESSPSSISPSASKSGLSNSIDSKDKRRHYLMKNKDMQQAESQSSAATPSRRAALSLLASLLLSSISIGVILAVDFHL